MIYLDNAATTQMYSDVVHTMEICNDIAFANPGSIHSAGWTANQWVSKARHQVASVVKASPQDVIFTSGGSESNSLALLGVADYLKKIGKTHILINPTEHKSVLKCAERLAEMGFQIEYLMMTQRGYVYVDDIEERIRDNTGLVSVMGINNETGVENDINSICDLCHDHGVLFHSDCVQAFGKRHINLGAFPIDFVSVSAHKIHGPKGVGCLFVQDKKLLSPLILGGSQEFGLRAGTENVPGIAGFGTAAETADYIFKNGKTKIQKIINGIIYKLGDIAHVNGAINPAGYIANMRFDGVSGESLVLLLSSKGVMVSAGSACTANSSQPSHVLKAMGLSDEEARSSIRISISEEITETEEAEAIEKIVGCVRELREVGAGE